MYSIHTSHVKSASAETRVRGELQGHVRAAAPVRVWQEAHGDGVFALARGPNGRQGGRRGLCGRHGGHPQGQAWRDEGHRGEYSLIHIYLIVLIYLHNYSHICTYIRNPFTYLHMYLPTYLPIDLHGT